MHYNKINCLFVALCLGATTFGQTGVHNMADAYGYNPSHAHQEQNFTFREWFEAGRYTDVLATSLHHPFDPPNNISTAVSTFEQPIFKDAKVRGMSFVYSDYSGSGSNLTYHASTSFSAHQLLKVDFGTSLFGSYRLLLDVPMHGFMAAQSSPAGNSQSNASAWLSVFASGNGVSANTTGTLGMHATTNTDATWQVSGDWMPSNVHSSTVDLPTPGFPRSVDGVEIRTDSVLDMGSCTPSDPNLFDISYDFVTAAENQSPNGSFALADFTGTGHLTFRMVDGSGNDVTDFTVSPVLDTVPEPTSIAAMVLGLGFLVRRRRKQK